MYPILEFDDSRTAVIEPGFFRAPVTLPEHCVLCFFNEVIGSVCTPAHRAHYTGSEIGQPRDVARARRQHDGAAPPFAAVGAHEIP